MTGGSAGIGRLNLNSPTLETISLVLPPLAEQAAILQVLTAELRSLESIRKIALALVERCALLDQCLLSRAFRGDLVPQDPNDEPASILLERIRELKAKKADEQRVVGKEAASKMKR
jgi:type I restriction enzyme S subunit